MQILSNQKKAKYHILFGNILLLQITTMLGKAAPRMQCACFVTKFSGCSTSRAAAHILGRPVLAQEKAGIRPCIAIYKKDDDRRSALRTAQKTIGEMMRGKEQSMDGKKRKQQVMDELLVSPSKQSVESSVIVSKS